MTKEELFAIANENVFGPVPSCNIARIGHVMARNYLGPVLRDAENVLLGLEVPRPSLLICLKNAFDFTSHELFDAFPDETKEVLEHCARNFRTRYQPLAQELELRKAA